MIEIPYNREKAVEYAKKWALKRNPEYFNYEGIGGDCTNFISQCVYAGCGVMNYTETFGWYYRNANDKSPAWTGVQYFYNFITSNKGVGPYGKPANLEELEVGDIIQLSDQYDVYVHSLILTKIVKTFFKKKYYICSHSSDSYQRNLSTYDFNSIRCIHIIGARK